MTKTKWHFSQKTMTKTKSKFAVKINTGPKTGLHAYKVKNRLFSQKIALILPNF